MIMKKVLLLSIMMLGLWSCSADNENDLEKYQTNVTEKSNTDQVAAVSASFPSCFTNLTGHVHVDVSNGFGNPIVVFTPIISGSMSSTARFLVRVEVEELSDCDTMSSGTGNVLSFGSSSPVQNVVASPPSVWVAPANMPRCYRWRFVFESISSRGSQICSSYSKWSESPLF